MGSNLAGGLMRDYMGRGLLAILFLAALIYLFITEKRKQVRLLFVYLPIAVLLLFFNPLFSYLLERFLGNEIYYRILWLLPMTVVTAYAAVTVCMRYEGWKRASCACAAAFLIMISGRCVYANAIFTKAENLYHVPDCVVHICDAIEIKGREVTAVFPLDLVQYVRQYSPVVCMPYGRELTVDKWTFWEGENALCDIMESEEPDAGILGEEARRQSCVYIVLPEEKKVQGDLSEQGYALFGEIDGYLIYKDVYFDPGI